MSDTPAHDSEVEEGSPFGGAECEESSPEPAAEDGAYAEDGENVENLYPIQNLAVEYYEDAPEASNASDNVKGEDSEELSEAQITENEESFDKSNIEDATTDPSALAIAVSYDDSYNSNNEALEEQDYKLQKTYIEDFIYSNAPSSLDESSNSNIEEGKEESRGSALSRFSKIVKAIEVADYETIQVLYQLLYQRSAWDTQEILTQRILEFSGFSFGQNSEDYFNREMMLRTQPNEVLIKLAALLGLDQVQKVMADMDKARVGLIQCIMTFLSRPNKKTRAGKSITIADNNKASPTAPSKCGCRSMCFRKIPKLQRVVILEYVKELQEKQMLDSYLMHMIELKKIIRKPGSYEDLKKLKEVTYQYYIKYGDKQVSVCKGAFTTMYNLTTSKIFQLQNKLKSGRNLPPKVDFNDFPPMTVVETLPKSKKENGTQPTAGLRLTPKRNRNSPKKEWVSSEEQVRRLEADVETEIKSTIESQKAVPKVVIEKFDVDSLDELNTKVKEDSKKTPLKVNADETSTVKHENTQLKDFDLVVKAIENAPEELLIDVHFLLFLNSTDADNLKENILEFGGFSFDSDTEEYDERNEFLQRMSFKMVSDVARSFSLAVLSNKEDTIKNVLSFLSKPDESYLRISAAMPLSLSDVEFDDLGDLSDSDVSITCEVVEKKVECIDLLSSGEDSDKEDRPRKEKTPQKSNAADNASANNSIMRTLLSPKSSTAVSTAIPSSASHSTAAPATIPSTAPAVPAADVQENSSQGKPRVLRDFETIRKIVNTHPHEYLVDIYDLLYLKAHEPNTLRSDILNFSGFTFEKGTTDYVKRKQLLDRMLYNSVRRIYNTLIHNTTEVKVFSKPTMITEIFQFLFKLPDHDTSVRPAPSSKPFMKPPFVSPGATAKNTPGSAAQPGPNLLSQSGKLSDLKRVFQRVACFPCEYLIDVHKLLFMTDCDQSVIRQNIFGFKGFPFSPDSQEFQQRKMYLEYLTFHSLRKISSVLTTRSVDLRNSTKHELATHLTEVLAEYCKTPDDTDTTGIDTSFEVAENVTNNMENSAVENIVVTPIIDPSITGAPQADNAPVSTSTVLSSLVESSKNSKAPQTIPISQSPLSISIIDARSVNTTSVTTVTDNNSRRKRKSNTVNKVIKNKPTPQQADTQSQFADVNLPEVEQYRQIYGTNLNIYPTTGPTITGIAFNTSGMVPQAFPQIIPQTLSFPVTYSQVQPSLPVVQQSNQLLGINQTLAPQIITQVSVQNNQSETIVPEVSLKESEETPCKKRKTVSPNENAKSSDEANSFNNKITVSAADDEDCDKPLSSLVGHPIDSVLKKHIADIVKESDLQTITINGVIQKVFKMYPKFDLSYRKEFLKSSLRSLLYKLGQEKNSESKSDLRDTESPDCSVTTTENCDNNSELPKAMDCAQ